MPFNSLTIEYRKISDLKPDSSNVRVHSNKQIKKICRSIEKLGLVSPIIVGPSGQIVDGTAVFLAAVKCGYDELPTITLTGRSDSELRMAKLAMNRLPEDANWNLEALKAEFELLIENGYDLLDTGFESLEIDMTLEIEEPGSAVVEDVPPLPDDGDPIARLGDVWRLGAHIVFCGDARNSTALKFIFKERSAAMLFTDPPYNVPVNGHVSGLGDTKHRSFPMASGEMSPEEFETFLEEFLSAALPNMQSGATAFVCMDWRSIERLLKVARLSGFKLLNLIVWAKTNAGMGSFYRSQHELIPVFKVGTDPHKNNFGLGKSGRSRSNLWTYKGMNAFGSERAELFSEHPTIKPLSMVADAIRDVTSRGEIVFDPFLGSGTTLLAAEQTGRTCCGVELDPRYVDLCVRRWEEHTGQKAERETNLDNAMVQPVLALPSPSSKAGE